jgi:hypothetical protein
MNWDDEDNSWMDALVSEVPAAPAKSTTSAGKGNWTWSPEFRAKISARRQLQVITDETRAKISAHNLATGKRPPDATGRKLSAETRQRQSKAVRERWHSTEPKWVEWREQQAQRQAARMAADGRRRGFNATRVHKVFHTPFGEFTHREEAVEYLRLAGVPNWRRWLEHHSKQNPTQYYFTRERVPK